MKDVMLDLETMGTSTDAAIIAIGAVEFDADLGQLGERFYQVVDLQSSVDLGGVIEPSTVMWWLQQSEAARTAIGSSGVHLAVALMAFTKWLSERAPENEVRIWGNGANFDNVVLANAYRRAQHQLPWRFFNDRCYRTIKALRRDIKLERSGTHHNALDDAVSQAKHLLTIFATATTLRIG